MKFEELKLIILSVFNEEQNIELEQSKDDVESWDSFGHLNLILEIENELNIQFTKSEIEEIDSFQTLLDIINQKIS
jgi:acyl carrier protein